MLCDKNYVRDWRRCWRCLLFCIRLSRHRGSLFGEIGRNYFSKGAKLIKELLKNSLCLLLLGSLCFKMSHGNSVKYFTRDILESFELCLKL